MPYRIRGTSVQVLKGGTWQTLKTYPTKSGALAYLAALKSNASPAHGGSSRKKSRKKRPRRSGRN